MSEVSLTCLRVAPPQVYLSRCIVVAGNDRLGLLLHRILRWQPRTRIIKYGRRWVAWSHARWCQELHLTPDQFRLVLEKMTTGPNPLLVRRQAIFDNLNVLHLGMTDHCLLQLAKDRKTRTPVEAKARTPVGVKAQTLYKNPKKESVEELEKIASGFAVASLGGPEGSEKEASGEQEQQTNVILFPDQGGSPVIADKKPSLTGEELEAQFIASAPKPLKVYHPDSAAPLIAIWRGVTGQYPTGQVMGMLKTLIKKVDPVPAPELLKYAIAHWGDIVYEAEASHGAFKCPDKPALGFLLKFAHVAVGCKKLADAKAAQSIADLADPDSEEAIKHAYLVKLGFKAAS